MGEFVVNLAGRTLGAPVVLDRPLSTAGAGLGRTLETTDTLLVARIERVDGVPHPMVVALAVMGGESALWPGRASGVSDSGSYVDSAHPANAPYRLTAG